jgi:purine-binding chemotaxis protein CheW
MKRMNEVGAMADRFLTFSLGTESFAIPLLQVKEVIALPEVTPVPQTPSYFLGIMNLRGQVITVLDLRTKLSIKPSEHQETVVIICDLAPYSVGVVVDSVNSVLAATPDQIAPKPELTGSKVESITGVYQAEGKLVLMLDISMTLNLTDYASVKKLQSQNDKHQAA